MRVRRPSVDWCDIFQFCVSLVGVIVASIIYFVDRSHASLPCSDSGGCELVAASRWSHITLGPVHNIPVALLGISGYLAIHASVLLRNAYPLSARFIRWLLLIISTIGVAYSWYLQYVAHFRVGAFCPWCFTSALLMTALFLSAILDMVRQRHEIR